MNSLLNSIIEKESYGRDKQSRRFIKVANGIVVGLIIFIILLMVWFVYVVQRSYLEVMK